MSDIDQPPKVIVSNAGTGSPLRVTIIGAGRVGMTIGRLCQQSDVALLTDVLVRRAADAATAIEFIGGGRPVSGFTQLQPADLYLLTVPDDQIEDCCRQLVASGMLPAHGIVAHCSGAQSAGLLVSASRQGAAVASVHPVRSFADPARVAADFAGTVCAIEGDPVACAVIRELFGAFGAHLIAIDARNKTLYHAGAVFASNYLVTLIDVAMQTYGQAGIGADDALRMIAPLLRETAENVFRLGPAAALTGPIARGDMATVARQQQALEAVDPAHAALYAQLTSATAALAARRTPDTKS
ncbi:MAG: DUF2520 domain-containing protein [Herminiimonas sp.]|nr:DUF2520 domain-containing protein [Herminiimonas sp.]